MKITKRLIGVPAMLGVMVLFACSPKDDGGLNDSDLLPPNAVVNQAEGDGLLTMGADIEKTVIPATATVETPEVQEFIDLYLSAVENITTVSNRSIRSINKVKAKNDTFPGAVYGKVKVGYETEGVLETDRYTYESITNEFFDFSNVQGLYLGGSVGYLSTKIMKANGSIDSAGKAEGTIRFAGKFDGRIVFSGSKMTLKSGDASVVLPDDLIGAFCYRPTKDQISKITNDSSDVVCDTLIREIFPPKMLIICGSDTTIISDTTVIIDTPTPDTTNIPDTTAELKYRGSRWTMANGEIIIFGENGRAAVQTLKYPKPAGIDVRKVKVSIEPSKITYDITYTVSSDGDTVTLFGDSLKTKLWVKLVHIPSENKLVGAGFEYFRDMTDQEHSIDEIGGGKGNWFWSQGNEDPKDTTNIKDTTAVKDTAGIMELFPDTTLTGWGISVDTLGSTAVITNLNPLDVTAKRVSPSNPSIFNTYAAVTNTKAISGDFSNISTVEIKYSSTHQLALGLMPLTAYPEQYVSYDAYEAWFPSSRTDTTISIPLKEFISFPNSRKNLSQSDINTWQYIAVLLSPLESDKEVRFTIKSIKLK